MARIAKFHESAPKTKRDKRRSAFTDSNIAVAWLNQARKTPAYRRVVGIYAHLDRLDGLLLGRIQSDAKNEWFMHQEEVNRCLERYLFTPRIMVDRNNSRRYMAAARSVRGVTVELSDGDVTIPVSEALAASALARLYATDELFHVHLCEHCRERWHARVRQMDKFCSRDCQIAFYGSSDEARKKHRRAQERYRKTPGFRNI